MSTGEKKEHLISSPTLEKSRQQGLGSKVFVEGAWPDKKWWTLFDSPALATWIEEAFANNPSLQAVESWIEQGKQVATIYRSKLYPTLYFNADDNYRYLSENGFTHLLNPSLPLSGYQVDLSLAFNYEFDFWSKNRNLFRAAIGEVKSREAELQQAQLIVAASLSQAYFALLTTGQKKRLYQQWVDVRAQKLALQQKLQKSALLSSLPVLLSDESVQEIEQQVVAMEDEIKVQTHLINVLMGKGPDADLDLGNLPSSPPQAISLPKDLSIELLSRRPDLMAQIWKAEALAAEVGAAKADFFPNINLAAFAGLESTLWRTLFQGPSHTVGYQPALSLPIFTAGSIRANVRSKKASFDQAIFQYNDLLLKAVQEVADLLSQVETVYRQKEMQENIVEDSQKRLDLTVLRQESGLDSCFDFLAYEEELLEKKIQEVNLTYQQYAFAIRLIKALGGGYLYSEVPISKEAS